MMGLHFHLRDGLMAGGVILWTTTNVLLFLLLKQVRRNVPLWERPFPSPISVRYCSWLWKRHKDFYPNSALRMVWLTNYIVCFSCVSAAFALLIAKSH